MRFLSSIILRLPVLAFLLLFFYLTFFIPIPASAAISVSATSTAIGLNSGLVGYWTMDGKDVNWTTNTMVDRSGNGNSLVLKSISSTSSPAQGKIGQAFKFNGATNCATTTYNQNINSGATISVWFKRNIIGAGSTGNIFGVSSQNGNNSYGRFQIGVQGFDIASTYYNGTSYNKSGTVNDTKWHFAAAVWNGVTNTLYVDGVPQNNTNGVSAVFGTIALGCRANQYDTFFNGYIDEARVYNRALSANEVKQLYNQGGGKFQASVQPPAATATSTAKGLNSGLVAYYTMDGKDVNWTTNRITDRSGNNATIYYKTVNVSGSLTPDATGVYNVIGMYAGYPIYQRGSDSFYIRWNTGDYHYYLAPNSSGAVTTSSWYGPNPMNGGIIPGTYTPWAGVSGNPIVTVDNSSGIYYILPSPAPLYGMSTTTSGTSGKIGQAMQFNGSTSYIDLGTSSSIQPTSAVTAAAWFKTPTIDAGDHVLIRYRGRGYELFLSNGKMKFQTVDSSNAQYAATYTANFGNNIWHYAVGTYDGTRTRLYIDGVLRDNQPGGVMSYSAGGGAIGRDGNFNGSYWLGQIDDARIYNRALSASEIKQLYNEGGGKFQDSPTAISSNPSKPSTGINAGLVGYYTMDGKDIDWTKGTMVDQSGNGSTSPLVFYNTVTVSGSLSPDASGVYTAAGLYDGTPYYQRGAEGWTVWMWWQGGNTYYWEISPTPFGTSGARYMTGTLTSFIPPDGNGYGGVAGASGTATVSSNTNSGIYYSPFAPKLVNLDKTNVAPGKIGQALTFGSVSNVSTSSVVAPFINIGMGAKSVSAWVRRTGTLKSFSPLVEQGGPDNNDFRFVYYNGGGNPKLCFGYDYVTNNFYCSPDNSFPAVLNKWYQVTATYNGSSVVIYINGVPFQTTQLTSAYGPYGAYQLNIGFRPYTAIVGPWVGQIDDVRVYNRALSQSEATQLYKMGL